MFTMPFDVPLLTATDFGVGTTVRFVRTNTNDTDLSAIRYRATDTGETVMLYAPGLRGGARVMARDADVPGTFVVTSVASLTVLGTYTISERSEPV